MRVKKVIIVFTRYPKPGQVKTRLIPELGPERATILHQSMTQHVVACAREAALTTQASLQVHFQGGSREKMMEWLGTGITYHPQRGRDLGERMREAFRRTLREGAHRVVLVGSDLPGLTREILDQAFQALESCQVVLGPTLDGGYYLIGLKEDSPELFFGIPWGSKDVMKSTLERIAKLGLKVKLLEMLEDVDRPQDLPLAACFLP